MSMADPRTPEAFFINVPSKLDHPFDDWRWFRTHEPVFHYSPLGAWWIFDYANVDALFHDPRLSSRRTEGFIAGAPPQVQAELGPLAESARRWVLMRDGADHMQMRRALGRRFGEHSVNPLEGKIQALIDELLREVDDALDVAADLAYLLPALVIGDLIGAGRDDRAAIVRWSDALATFFNTVPPTVEIGRRAAQATAEMEAFVRTLIEARRAAPTDDLMTDLVRSGDLCDDDIVANCVVLLVAGHETTRASIGNAVHLLLTHPDQLAALRADLSLLPAAIEEVLRFEPPNPFMARLATEDLDVGGHTIPAGAMVYLMLGSANRDERTFPHGDRFDILRPRGKHLAFGSGPHYCLGAVLARLEMRLALRALLTRFPALRLDPARPPHFVRQMGMRGPVSLPVLLR